MTYGRGFWFGVVIGWSVIAIGVLNLFLEAARTHPDQWIRWFVGALLAHDLVLAPAVFLAGRLTRRWRPAVRYGLIASAVLTLVAYPLVRGYGRDPLDPSSLPQDYATNVIVLLSAIWLVVLGAVLFGRRRERP